jgi:hypothetical protein
MLSNILIILGVIALTLALRSFRHPFFQKLGALGILATSFLFGYLLTGSLAAGIFCAALWFLLPWFDLLTRIRRLTLPLERNLRQKTPPNSQTFPNLAELTGEVEGEGFEHIVDAGWDWEEYQQFFRLFYKADERLQAAICLIDQGDVSFYYLSVSSRAKDGTIWTTWNYPFSYSLKLVPAWRVNRQRGDQTFLQLIESHRDYLRRNAVTPDALEELDADGMQEEIQKDLRAQIAHNLASGVLTRTDGGEVRYSWRGLFFLWFQFLRDLVRLS